MIGQILSRAAAKTYFVPGSWAPLAVIMAIFFAKYVHAVMNAMNAAVIDTTPFVVGLSDVYGSERTGVAR